MSSWFWSFWVMVILNVVLLWLCQRSNSLLREAFDMIESQMNMLTESRTVILSLRTDLERMSEINLEMQEFIKFWHIVAFSMCRFAEGRTLYGGKN